MFGIRKKTTRVDNSNVQLFIDYCGKFGKEHDDSYLPAPDWLPSDDDPTYILQDPDGSCIGAVSAMLSPALRRIGRCRLRILHAASGRLEDYEWLIDAIYRHLDDVDYIYMFVPEDRSNMRRNLEAMGFSIERYSWCLAKNTADASVPLLPPGYSLKPFRPGIDDDVWCSLINTSFEGIRGHVDMDTQGLSRMLGEPGYRPEGMLILWHGSEPAGTVRITAESDDSGGDYAEIGALSVLPSHRRNGLGRALVRMGVYIGSEMGFDTALLSVNAENINAAELYLSEGFEKIQVMICYSKFL